MYMFVHISSGSELLVVTSFTVDIYYINSYQFAILFQIHTQSIFL